MKVKFLLLICLTGIILQANAQKKDAKKSISSGGYTNNCSPLRPNPYVELPLGSIKAEGWLKEMLVRQKTGATGQLDKLYLLVMDKRNGWLGGDGDQWQ